MFQKSVWNFCPKFVRNGLKSFRKLNARNKTSWILTPEIFCELCKRETGFTSRESESINNFAACDDDDDDDYDDDDDDVNLKLSR